jgi:hypothetical protein
MSWAEHIHILSFMRHWISLRPDAYLLLSQIEDVRRCKAEGKLASVALGARGSAKLQSYELMEIDDFLGAIEL